MVPAQGADAECAIWKSRLRGAEELRGAIQGHLEEGCYLSEVSLL